MNKPRKLFATFFMTLDGVVEQPSWSAPYWNDEISDFKEEETNRASALLLGRITYEQFASAWPGRDDPGAAYFNGVRKHVVSTTLTKDIWENATFIASDMTSEIKKLKANGEGDIAVHGSITLARFLLKEGLLDELRLLIYPVAVGTGMKLFDETVARDFQLKSSKAFSNGVLGLTYTLR